MSVITKLKSLLSSLPPAERRVGEYILNNLETAPLMSIHDLAGAADVSLPTVTRIVRKLGCDGFIYFKLALAADNAANNIRNQDAAESKDDLVSLSLGEMNASIEELSKTVDRIKLEDMVNRVTNARRVLILADGFMMNHANNFTLRMSLAGIDATATVDRAMTQVFCDKLKSGDVIFYLTQRCSDSFFIQTITNARKNGVCCAVITTADANPPSKLADYVFQCHFLHHNLDMVTAYGNEILITCLLRTITIMLTHKMMERYKSKNDNQEE